MKTLKELNCHMVYIENKVMNAINGCLVKTDNKAGCIKVFVYNTKEECLQAATLWANNNKRDLKNAGWGSSYQVYFENYAEYDGFKIGGDFDRDVFARACGYQSGDTVARIKFESKQGYAVTVDFMSIGEQRISINTSDKEAQEIAAKYGHELESEKDKIDWLESLENDFNCCDITYESKLYAAKELEAIGCLNWRDNSWYEAHIEIIHDGRTLLSDYESNIVLGCEVYSSIEEVRMLDYEEAHAAFVDAYLELLQPETL